MAEAVAPRAGVVRRIYANLTLLLGGKAGAGLLSLAYLAIAARALGPADYGVLVLVHAWTIMVGGVVNFPGWHAVVRYGAQAQDDPPRLLRLLRLTAAVELGAAAVAVAVAAGLAPWVGPHLGWPPQALAFAGPYSLAVLASARSTPAGYLQLRRRFGLLAAHNLVSPAVRLAGSVAAAAVGWGLRGFLAVWLAAAVAEGLAMWALGLWAARRDLAGARLLGGMAGVRRENPGVWRFMIAANSDVTFSELSGRMAPLAVGWILGPAAAGLYAVAQRAGVVLAQPALALGQAAYAELAVLAASPDGARRVPGAVARCIGLALPPGLLLVGGVTVFAPELARLLAGGAFVGAAGVLAWIALARVVLLAAPPLSAALVALGRPGRSVQANIASSAGLFPLLLWMLSRYGLPGAGVQAVIQAAAAVALLAGALAWPVRRRRGEPSAA